MHTRDNEINWPLSASCIRRGLLRPSNCSEGRRTWGLFIGAADSLSYSSSKGTSWSSGEPCPSDHAFFNGYNRMGISFRWTRSWWTTRVFIVYPPRTGDSPSKPNFSSRLLSSLSFRCSFIVSKPFSSQTNKYSWNWRSPWVRGSKWQRPQGRLSEPDRLRPIIAAGSTKSQPRDTAYFQISRFV